MKSLVCCGENQMRIEEREIPTLGPKEVLVKVMACGLCGTDMHIFNGGKYTDDDFKDIVLGREFSGEIAAIGSDVTSIKLGTRVAVNPNLACDTSVPTRDGQPQHCTKLESYGVTLDGGLSEYCVVSETAVYPLGKNTTYEQGAMASTLSCCMHAIDMCDIKTGDQVVVFGGGMAGLMMLQLAKLSGASRVAFCEPNEEKLQIGRGLGADIWIKPSNEYVKAELKKVGFDKISAIIDCVGHPKTIELAIEAACRQTTVMMFGPTPAGEKIELDAAEMFRKEIILRSAYTNPFTIQRALDLIEFGKIDVTSMVEGECTFEEVADILRDPELQYRNKYIVKP